MLANNGNDDYSRISLRIHNILKDKIAEHQKEELLPTRTEAIINLIKKGLKKVKEEKKEW